MTTPQPRFPQQPPPPARGGMPKWLIVLIVLLLILFLGCCGGIATCYYVGKRTVNAIQEEAGLNIDFSGNGISLPTSFPADVPVHKDFRAVGSVAPKGKSEGYVQFRGKGDPAAISKFYKTELAAKGWTEVTDQTSGDAHLTTYKKGDLNLNVNVTGTATDCMLGIGYSKGGTPPAAPQGMPGNDDAPEEAPTPTPTPAADPTPEPAAQATGSNNAFAGAGKMPSNFPSDVPVFTGLTATPVSFANRTDNSGMVVLSGKVDKDKAVEFYTRELVKQGWKREQNLETGNVTILSYTKDKRSVNLSFTPDENKTDTSVTIAYDEQK